MTRVALVTGASGGIGSEIARRLAKIVARQQTAATLAERPAALYLTVTESFILGWTAQRIAMVPSSLSSSLADSPGC